MEIETKLRFLVQAVGRRANRTAADFIQGTRDWQEFRLGIDVGKITGTLARAVRVDGRGKVRRPDVITCCPLSRRIDDLTMSLL